MKIICLNFYRTAHFNASALSRWNKISPMVERIVLCSCTIKQTGIRVQQIRREKDNNPDEIDNTKN